MLAAYPVELVLSFFPGRPLYRALIGLVSDAIDARQSAILRANPNATAFELMMVGADSPAMASADQRMHDWLGGHPDKPIVYRKHNQED